MKTQLLEDIGQSAELSVPPALTSGPPKAAKREPGLVVPGKAWSAQRRAAGGVWRQKPADEALTRAAPEPEVAPAPELREVFEEIAALEAQFVQPVPQIEPAAALEDLPQPPLAAPLEPRPDAAIPLAETTLVGDPTRTADPPHDPVFDFTLPLPTSPAEPRHEPVIRSAGEAILDWTPAPSTNVGRDPLFDFTPPTTPLPAADPFTPAAAGRKRSPRRYLLWAGCLLAAGLLVQGGRWLYQERADAGSLALVAEQAREMAPVGQAATRQAVVVAQSAPAPDAGARVAPAAVVGTPSSGVPPLVMLKPEEYTPHKEVQPAPTVKVRDEAPSKPKPKQVSKAEPKPEPKSTPKPESRPKPAPQPAAKQRIASPLPKPAIRKAEAPSRTVAEPAKEKRKREPVRQLAQTSASAPERPAGPDTSMDALLKACREHGYHATQCIRRGCSVTQYGFACRGR